MTERPPDDVCNIGVSYVGLTMAVPQADAGYRVHGVERSSHIRKCTSAGGGAFLGTGLDEHLSGHISFDPGIARFDIGVCETLEAAFDGASLVMIRNDHRVSGTMDIGRLSALMAAPGIVAAKGACSVRKNGYQGRRALSHARCIVENGRMD